MPVTFAQLQEMDVLARRDAVRYPRRREMFGILEQEQGRHFVGIVGPRGTGKTVLLKQLAAHIPDSFYLALDTFDQGNLFECAGILGERYGIRNLFLDEVHFHRDIDGQLKKIFDFLPLRVFFTSSVSLSMFQSAHDLSRRVRLVHLYPFSFREYVYFKTGDCLELLSIDSILRNDFDRKYLRYGYLFDSYLRGAIMPFSLEEPDILPLLRTVLRTVLTRDIPTLRSLMLDEPAAIEKTLMYVARSPIEGINFSSISRNAGITKYKAEQYVGILRDAFILNPVFPGGANVLREPKVLMCLPYRLLFQEYESALGGLREDFFAETMRMAGIEFSYLKSMRGAKTPDFLIRHNDDELVIEVGGKNKGRQQFKGIDKTKSLLLSHADQNEGIRRPLFLIGFIA